MDHSERSFLRIMESEQNFINKATIEFQYSKRNLAIRCNELIEKIFVTHILPKMDEAFSLKSFHGINLELASLEIDIGKIKEQDLERYLGERIKQALASKLSEALSKKSSLVAYHNTSSNPDGLIEEGLYFFLIKGFMPEWIAGMDMAKLMEQIFHSKPSYFKLLLKKISKNRDAKKRWVFGISEKQFDRLIQNIEPSNSDWILSFRTSLVPTLKKSEDFPSEKGGLEKNINYFILEFLSVQSGSKFNRLNFSKSVLKQTAARYNVSFLELVDLLETELDSKEYENPLSKSVRYVLILLQGRNTNFFVGDRDSEIEQIEGVIPEISLRDFELENDSPLLNDKMKEMEFGDRIKINNAGLVLTWPFLTMFFTKLGVMEGNQFKSEAARNRAVYLLQYLVFGETDFPEYELVLNKLLVGMPLATHLESGIELTEEEKNISKSLLNGIIQNWAKLNTSNIEALQVTFLQRVGDLSLDEEMVNLKVEPIGVDVLMESISWNIKMVKLPWMQKAIQINWK